MEVQPVISPAERKEIDSLKGTVQTFIDQHQTGKGDARKSVIPALRNFLASDFQSVDAAYAKIFSVIDEETGKTYKKVPKMFGFLSGLRMALQANQKLYQKNLEIEASEKARRENEERFQRELDAARAKPAQVVEKVVEKIVQAPAAAVQAEEKKSRTRSGSHVSKRKLAAAEAAAKAETERAAKAEAEKREAERKLAETQKLLHAQTLDGAEAKKTYSILEEERKEHEKVLKKQQEEMKRQLAEKDKQNKAEVDAVKKEATLTIGEELRKAAEEIRQANAKANEATRAEADALRKATEAEKSKLEEAQSAFKTGKEKGYDEGYEKGEAAGDVKGQRKVFLALKNVAQADEDFAEALQKHKEHFKHLTGGVQLLEGPARADSMQSFNAEMPSAQSRSRQRTQSKPTERTIISSKEKCMEYLIEARAQFIGKHFDTSEDKKRNELSLAAIEYFIGLVKAHPEDKTLADIHTDVCDFMRAAQIDCPIILNLTCDASEKLSMRPLTKEQTHELIKLFQQNPFGFNPKAVEEVIGVFRKYLNENQLVNVERRLKQIFTRAIEASMIETWLAGKYPVVQKLVNLCREFGQKGEAPENLAVIEGVKIAVLLLIALGGMKTTAELLQSDFIKKLPAPVIAAIQSQVELDGGNEHLDGQQLSSTKFAIFAALFQSTKFFVFADKSIYEYFNTEGKNPDLKTCLAQLNKKLQELTTSQQAPRGSSAMYKPEQSSKAAAAAAPKAPLVETGVNLGTGK